MAFGWALIGITLLASPAIAHDAGQARVLVTAPTDGPVAVRIEMARIDAMDLIGVAPETPIEHAALAEAVTAQASGWVGVFSGDAPCPLTVGAVEALGVRGLALTAQAACPGPPSRVEWPAATHPRLKLSAIGSATLATGEVIPLSFNRAAVIATLSPGDGLAPTFGAFLLSGVEHIVIGWDHLAFLLALLLSCSRLGRVVGVVTAFTVAHSITLVLGATGVVELPPEIVEPIIAISIAVAGAHGLWQWRAGRLDHPGRAEPVTGGLGALLGVCFAFGLVHGLGFAGLLAELLPPGGDRLGPLVGFNVGVELGQLVCVAIGFPILVAIGRRPRGRVIFGGLLGVLVGLGVLIAALRVLG